MAVEIKVPALGESVTEATVSKWLVKAGDTVADRPAVVRARDRQGHRRGECHGGRHHRRSRRRRRRHRPGGRRALPHRGGRRRRSRRQACRRCRAAGCRPSRAEACRRLPRLRRRPRRSPLPRLPPRAPIIAASGPATRKLVEETGVAAVGDPAHRQGRPRHQGRRDGGAVVDPGAVGARPPSPRRRPARARAPTARSGCA